MTRRTLALAAVFLSMLAACGSTVQNTASRTVGGGATSAEQQSLGEGLTADAGSSGAPHAGAVGGTAAGRSAASGGASGRSGAGGAAASGTPNRSPLSLGILYTVNDGAQSAGVDNGNTFNLGDAVRAFVDGYNASGGLAGRRIVATYAELHSASSNYEGDVQAVCTTFTQDHHVAAVISNLGYYSPILLSCLQKASVPLISGDYVGPDQQDADRYPVAVTPATLLGDVRVAAVVERLAGSGFMTARNRVGVLVEGCPVDERVHQNGLVPALRRAGLTLAATVKLRCFLSLQDYGGQASDIQGAVLQFRQANVDRVIIVSQGAEANILNLFAAGADAQGYTPGYALSSVAAATVVALNAPARQLANAKGVGWLPVLDSANGAQEPATATASRCLGMLRKQGVAPTSAADYFNVYGPCDSFELYAAVLRATNGDASASAVLRAVGQVASSYVAAATVGGKVRMFGDHVGAGAARLFGWVNGRFEYTGPAFGL